MRFSSTADAHPDRLTHAVRPKCSKEWSQALDLLTIPTHQDVSLVKARERAGSTRIDAHNHGRPFLVIVDHDRLEPEP